jgi:hypothetical protein
VSEHTWGLDVKTFLHDWQNWSNADFDKAEQTIVGYKLMTNSWLEQRSFITNAIRTLNATSSKYTAFAAHIDSRLAQLVPKAPPSTQGFSVVPPSQFGQVFTFNNFELSFDPVTGAISHLIDHRTQMTWARHDAMLARYR